MPFRQGALAGGVKPFPVGRKRQRDGRVPYRNPSDDGFGPVAVDAGAGEVDDGDRALSLLAHEEQLIVGGDVDIDVTVRAVAQRAYERLARARDQPPYIQKVDGG